MIFKSLIDTYEKYLVSEKITNEASSKSYVSYLRSAFLEIFGEHYIDIDFVNASQTSPIFDQYIAYTAEYLRNGIDRHSPKQKHASKTYRNYLSAFLSFKAFLKNQGIADISFQTCPIPQSFSVIKGEIALNHSQLMTKFRQRLCTQDRAYCDVMYIPALINNIIKMVPANAKQYRKLIDNSLEDMKIYHSGGNRVQFKDVENITINTLTKEVSFTDKSKKRYIMYTENPKTHSFENFSSVDFRELSIDHDIPLEQLLSNNNQSFPTLYKLSEILKNHFKCTGSDYKSMRVGNKSLKDAASKKDTFDAIQSSIDQAFSLDLFREMEKLYGKLSYSIMYFPYNAAKSNTI